MRRTTNSLQELEQFVDRMWERLESQGAYRMESLPVDIAETDDAFVVTADVPGCERDDLEVRLLDPQTLQITMDHSEHVDERDDRYIRQERRHRTASRTLELPGMIDEDEVTAEFRHGVLTVRLPRSAAHETGTDIEISE
ncbi:Hsp20/alpha crystallin family protein [Haloarchaeobius litoreus]|uniref:Hsp20/alpha crystallin family protein n=1 Tax=Haloarchaeobius litoreus TaxID=755306 RepID=A0ABD6DSJ7_9EURY|nr:Hsp20/alpha crystallin family protein [Haloarchaeobius litoreus]